MSLASWFSSLKNHRQFLVQKVARRGRTLISRRQAFFEKLERRDLLAVVYNANEMFVRNELAAPVENNPSFGPFSVGYNATLGGFTPYTAAEHNNNKFSNANIQGFVFPGTVPMAMVNVSTTSQTTSYGATLDPSQIMLHPNTGGVNGILRFTAPTTGSYTIAGDWESVHSGITRNMVLRNNVTLFSSTADNSNFNLTPTLNAGDTIDFVVNDFDGIGADSTGLRAVVTAPDPVSGNILIAGGFELPLTGGPGSFARLPAYGPWTSSTGGCGAGSTAILGMPYSGLPVREGVKAMHLGDCFGPGSVTETFPTVIGVQYAVSLSVIGWSGGAGTVQATLFTPSQTNLVANFNAPGGNVWGTNTYTFTATSTLTSIRVQNASGASTIDDVRVIAANSLPTVAANAAAVSANEGGIATNTGTFSDAQGNATITLTASVGTVTQDNTAGTWSWSRNVADGPNGPTSVTITATDNQNASALATFTFATNNVPPTISLNGNATVDEGSPYTLNLGVVTDPGLDTITKYIINWGDGTNSGLINGNPANTMATHIFADGPATQTNEVTVTDEDGTFLAGSLKVKVLNVAPTATLQSNSGVIYGNSATASFSDIFDPSNVDTTAGLRYAFSLDTDTTGSVTYAMASTVASADFGVQNAGAHTVYARIIDTNGGFNLYMTPLLVSQAHVNATADAKSKVYDNNPATDPALTYAAGSLITGNSFSGSLTRDAGQTVAGGPYAIRLGSLTAGSNYIIDYIGADFTITKASTTTTVSIVGAPFTYNGSAQTPATVTVTGAGGLSLTPTASYVNNTNAGTATASYSYAESANYLASSDSKNFNIAKASSTTVVTIAAGTFTYNGSAQTPATVTVTGAGGLSLTPTASYANNTNAGTATASYSYAESANYLASSDSKNFAIAKANQTITWASPEAVNYGTPLSSTQLNATVAGIAGGSAAGALTYTPTAGSVLLAGTQALSVTAAATTNYNEATKSVSLVVNPYVSSGYLSPISVNRAFKQGSTVPIKWQVNDSNGNPVTSLAAITSLTVTGPGGTTTLYPGNNNSSGATVLRNEGSQFIYNWQTKGFALGSYRINAKLADGTTVTQTIMLSASGSAAALVINGVTGQPAVGALLAGDVSLFIDNSNGAFSSDELARIQETVSGIQALVSPYGSNIVIVDASIGLNANIVLNSRATSVLGGMANGVLGVSTSAGEITIIDGWNWYAGANVNSVGSGQYDFQTVMTHEIGHSLGLGHGTVITSVMYPALSTAAARRTMLLADLQTAGEANNGSGLHAEAIFATTVTPAAPPVALPAPLASFSNSRTDRVDGDDPMRARGYQRSLSLSVAANHSAVDSAIAGLLMEFKPTGKRWSSDLPTDSKPTSNDLLDALDASFAQEFGRI